MKFYSRILGDRDYSLFEVMHFGLRLPGTLSSFGPVNSISVSNWSAVKRGRALRCLKKDERATYLSKVEIFNIRAHLELPRTVLVSHLESLSFYAFWRMYDVVKGRIVRRQHEKMTAVNGTGWPAQAKRSHPHHCEYARKTLYAYMPCYHLRGTDYIDEAVDTYYGGNWTAALRAFARDENNLWCPPWIRRNYEIRNKENNAEEHSSEEEPEKKEESGEKTNADDPADDNKSFPHAQKFKMKFVFAESGEPEGDADPERPEEYDTEHLWKKENRPPWQQHSELGPNLNAESHHVEVEPLPDVVNPRDHDWSSHYAGFNLEHARTMWNSLQDSSTHYSDPDLTVESLRDDYQMLFVHIVFQHVQDILEAISTGDTPKPLRMMLLGTAGTGKTRAIQTLLKKIQDALREANLPLDFVRVAAPTGTAAFNIRFNASTVHRLIHWLTPRYFNLLKDMPLATFQEYMRHTRLIVVDEVSMVGRQMMGRIDSRLQQATPGRNPDDEALGGLSYVSVGDPAQCEALFDQQIYDLDARKIPADAGETSAPTLSNRGLDVYAQFDDVIILTKCHRLS